MQQATLLTALLRSIWFLSYIGKKTHELVPTAAALVRAGPVNLVAIAICAFCVLALTTLDRIGERDHIIAWLPTGLFLLMSVWVEHWYIYGFVACTQFVSYLITVLSSYANRPSDTKDHDQHCRFTSSKKKTLEDIKDFMDEVKPFARESLKINRIDHEVPMVAHNPPSLSSKKSKAN